MALTAAAACWSQSRIWARAAACRVPGLLLLCALLWPGEGYAQAVSGEASLTAANGYARLVVKLAEDVDSEVALAGSILVIRFKRPVDVPVDQLSDVLPDYVGSARRDPDGAAIRLALSRKVTVNSMVAGERLFVDLLPDSWKGPPPGLPQDVVRELSERAREAERALRQQRVAAEAKKRPPVRVRASVQPTFVRYVFELQDGAGVSSSLNERKFSLMFDAPLTFDLADAKLIAPTSVGGINQKIEGSTSKVEIGLIGDVDVHSFREDKNYVVDIGFRPAERPQVLPVVAPKTPPQPVVTAPAQQHGEADTAPKKSGENPAPVSVVQSSVPSAAEAKPMPPQSLPTMPATADAASVPAAPPVQPLDIAAKPSAPAPATANVAAANKDDKNGAPVSVSRSSDGLRLNFAFATPTPVALFRRADALWLVLDSAQPIDLEPIRRNAGAVIGDVSSITLAKGQAIRMRLATPQLVSLAGVAAGNEATATAGDAGTNWALTFAETLKQTSQPLVARRNVNDVKRASITIPLARPGSLHRITDPDAGDTLLVVTALPPAQGFIKRQNFVELSVLESVQGVVVRPNSDDVIADVAADTVTLTRPGGLTLSAADIRPERATTSVGPIFDDGEWRQNKASNFSERRDKLIDAMAAAAVPEQIKARLALARFYMAWAMYPEAKAVLDVSVAESKPGNEDAMTLIVHAVASSLMGRPELTLKDLASPAIGPNYHSQLWKGLAYARQQKWPAAREAFKNAEFAVTTLPLELQRALIVDAMKAALAVRDFAGASARSDDLDSVGVTSDLKPAVAVLRGRLAEGLGHDKDALRSYRAATASEDRQAAAEGKLLEIALRQRRNEIAPDDALRELEMLSMLWRGDSIEVQALRMLTQLYGGADRYADALAAAKVATQLQPNSEASRQAQDEASALFVQLFLGPKGDEIPPIDALAVFYDYRELTPIGRRGDELIRRLADRLIAVDLLDQAGQLLQYQIDHRLEGAARAQVASRLAMVYLMSHKPDRAIAALRATRIADLAGELRQQRLLLEARAQSDVGRRDLALEIIGNMTGREAIRLRSDIYWAGRRWRESAEQIELYYGERWRDFKPLNTVEKGDVVRAAIGYALAEDALGLARFREKYAPLMSSEADRAAFDIASKPASASSADFARIAKLAGSVDTLDGFLREMQARFPDTITKAALPPAAASADPTPTGALPAIVGTRRADASR